jgi:hypothetical protein
MQPRTKYSQICVNAFLFLMSTGVAIALIEISFVPFVLPRLPVILQRYLPYEFQSTAQSSYSRSAFSESASKQLIAVLGDSYAVGMGDEYDSKKYQVSPVFGTLNRIHRALNVDVIGLGHPGAGSLTGILGSSIRQLKALQSSKRFSVPDPDYFLVYFYEGNDIDNNLEDLERRFEAVAPRSRLREEGVFKDFLQKEIISKSLSESSPLVWGEFTFPHWIFKFLYSDIYIRRIKGISPEEQSHQNQKVISVEMKAKWQPGTNVLNFEGKEYTHPDTLQAPALEMTPDEIDDALFVFNESVKMLQQYYPQSKIGVLYIPAPLSSYPIVSKKVSTQGSYHRTWKGRNNVYTKEWVSKRHLLISGRVEEFCNTRQIAFRNARQAMLKASRAKILHGTRDWDHFNENGYEILSKEAIELVKRLKN